MITPADAPAEPALPRSPLEDRDAFLTLLLTLIGEHRGVHLATVAEALRIGVREVRPYCDRWGVPIREVKRAGRSNKGVHIDDLLPMFRASPTTGPAGPSRPAADRVADPVTSTNNPPATPQQPQATDIGNPAQAA